MEEYEQELTGFKLATELDTYISTVQPEMEVVEVGDYPPRGDPDPALFKRLSIKFNLDVTKHSFDYIDNLWNATAEELHLPPLAVLLAKLAGDYEVNTL